MQRALLILLFVVSYLLFAGVEPWSLIPMLAIAAAAAAAAPAKTLAFPRRDRPLDLALGALMAAIAIQLLPLPVMIASSISPRASALSEQIRLAPLGAAPPAWTPLSVNPDATLISLGTVSLGVLTFWVARAVFSAGGSTRVFCRALAFLGALAATMVVIQKAIAPRAVLFLMVPEVRSANPFGAFINRNHFAAWLLLVATPVAGYCIARLNTRPSRARRWRESIGQIMSSGAIFTTIASMLMIGVLLLSLSRSALAGLGAAAGVGWLLGRSRLRIERTSIPGALGFAGAVILLLVLFVDVDGWATRLEQSLSTAPSAFSRLTIWRESMPIIEDFWAAGTGAGTYSNAMTVYQQTRVWVGAMQNWAHFNNAHSFYVQVASEGGLLLAIPALWALLATALLGRRAVAADKGEMFWVRVGAAAGLTGLAVQNIWEVALIMPANAVMAGILAGLLLYQREAVRSEQPMTTPERLTPSPVPLRMAR